MYLTKYCRIAFYLRENMMCFFGKIIIYSAEFTADPLIELPIHKCNVSYPQEPELVQAAWHTEAEAAWTSWPTVTSTHRRRARDCTWTGRATTALTTATSAAVSLVPVRSDLDRIYPMKTHILRLRTCSGYYNVYRSFPSVISVSSRI